MHIVTVDILIDETQYHERTGTPEGDAALAHRIVFEMLDDGVLSTDTDGWRVRSAVPVTGDQVAEIRRNEEV